MKNFTEERKRREGISMNYVESHGDFFLFISRSHEVHSFDMLLKTLPVMFAVHVVSLNSTMLPQLTNKSAPFIEVL